MASTVFSFPGSAPAATAASASVSAWSLATQWRSLAAQWWAGQPLRTPAEVSPVQRQRDARAVLAMAQRFAPTHPGFASDLRAAAFRALDE